MSMNDLFGGGGGKPKLITVLTSGTGTYVPTEDNARCFVRMQAGGGGGGSRASSAGGGGGAGQWYEFWDRVPLAGRSYAIAAAAGTDTKGNNTSFGQIKVLGGAAGVVNSVAGVGGGSGLPFGIPGGGGATTTGGSAFGIPTVSTGTGSTGPNGGGDSRMGLGGAGAAPGGNATGYGGGGGGGTGVIPSLGGSGSGGYIEIWDFGA